MSVDLGTISFPITVMPCSLTANVKSEGARTGLHDSIEQGDQTDTVKWAVVGHLNTQKVKDGRKVIYGASSYLTSGPGLNPCRPFEQAGNSYATLVQTSLAPLKMALPTRSILISFRTIIRAKGNKRIFRNTELS